MQIRRYFTDRQAQAVSDVAFRRVSVAADDTSSRFVFAPGNWPLGAIEAFAANALLTHPVPAARRQVYEAGIPPALRGHKTLCETDRSHEPVGRLETDVRDTIARVSGGLARHGLDHGYFDSTDDAVVFQEELGAAQDDPAAVGNAEAGIEPGEAVGRELTAADVDRGAVDLDVLSE